MQLKVMGGRVMASKSTLEIDLVKKKWPIFYWCTSSLFMASIFLIILSPLFWVFGSLVLSLKVLFSSASIFMAMLFLLKCMMWEVRNFLEENQPKSNSKSKFQQRLDDYMDKQKKNTSF